MTILPERADGSSADQVLVEVWVADYGDAGTNAPMEALAATFEEAYPEYRVALRFVPYADMAQAALEDDAAPALVNYPAQATGLALSATDAVGAPLYTPLGEALKEGESGDAQAVDDKRFIPALLSSFTVAGRTWAYPLRTGTLQFYANDRELREAGVKNLPRTWDGVERACRRIIATRPRLKTCLAIPNDSLIHEQHLAQAGSPIVDSGNGRTAKPNKVLLRQSQLGGWIQQLRRLRDADALVLTPTWEEAAGMFTKGRAAFTIDSSQGYDAIASAGAANGFAVQGGPTPSATKHGSHGTPVIGDSLWLRAELDEPELEGALTFVRHLHSDRASADLHILSGAIPSTRGAVETLFSEGWFGFIPQKLVPLNQLEAPPRRPSADGMVAPGQPGISAAMEWAVAAGVTGRADVMATVEKAHKRAERALELGQTRCEAGTRRSECLAITASRSWAPVIPPTGEEH